MGILNNDTYIGIYLSNDVMQVRACVVELEL